MLLQLLTFFFFPPTALSFIRDFIKVKFLQLKESVREHKAHKASSDLIVNHWLRFFVGTTASFQIQIIVRILLWPHRLVGGVSLPYPKHNSVFNWRKIVHNVVFVSDIQQHKSAISIHISSPS